MAALSYSSSVELPPQHQVFINFHGTALRSGFVAHLVRALEINKINFFVDMGELRSEPLEILLKRIEQSGIALVIFSGKYTESIWCLRELAIIAECVEKGKLVVIPIYYKLDRSTVSGLMGKFGDAFRGLRERRATMKMWKNAIRSISDRVGVVVDKMSNEGEIIEKIVENVEEWLDKITWEVNQIAYVDPLENSHTQTSLGEERDKTFGIKQRLNEWKEKLDLNKIRSQLAMIIGCLLALFFVLQQTAYTSTSLIGDGGAIDRIAVNVPKVEYIPREGTENPRHTYKYGEKPERSSSGAKTANADFFDRTSTNSRVDGKVKPWMIQVFINFRGDQLRNNFVGYLVDALRRSEINIFIDNQEQRGEDLNTLFKRIEDSGIAIVVFSSRYTESKWCLEELVKIKERVEQGLLKVLPIYYKVSPTHVKRLKGEFGDHFRDKEYMYELDDPRIKRWKEAIAFVSHKFGLTLDEKSALEIDFVETIVKEVLRMLQAISNVESGQSSR